MTGLNDLPRDTWPTNLPLVFWAFRVMVGLGLLMIALGGLSLYLRRKGRLYDEPWLHRFAVAMGPSGLIAVTAGWVVTEAGRQPFTVYGLLRTADSVSPIAAPAVAASLAAFAVVYFAVFGAESGTCSTCSTRHRARTSPAHRPTNRFAPPASPPPPAVGAEPRLHPAE